MITLFLATAGKIVLAVPIAPEDALEELRKEVDEIIYLSTRARFSPSERITRNLDSLRTPR